MNNEILFKVKCIYIDLDCLTVGEEYNVVEVDDGFYKVRNDCGITWWYYNNRFETLDRESNPKGKQEFSVGDNVYKYGETDVKTVLEVFNDGYMNLSNYPHRVNHESICHATQENYEMLRKLYQHIEFELPPKEITGSDLTKGMFERGDFAVVCKCSNIGEYSAIASSSLRLITEYSKGRFLDNTGHLWGYAVPCDTKTKLPLTEGVLNENIYN